MEHQGLSQAEAVKKLQQFGLNQLAAKKSTTSAEILLDQFRSPLIYVLLLAMI